MNTNDFYNSASLNYDNVLGKGYLPLKIRNYMQGAILKTFKSGSRLLDIGSGTGTDAIFFAGNGFFITALEPSEKMFEIANEKVIKSGWKNQIDLFNIGAEEILSINKITFDCAYSNFNAFNHIEDLYKLSDNLAEVLASNAKLFIIMLNKLCLVESLLCFLLFKPLLALKKLFNRQSTFNVPLKLYYPGTVKRIFSGNFRTNSIKGFGILLPPDSFSGLYNKFSKLINLFDKTENFISSVPPFYCICDHYFLELEKK